MKLFHLRLFKSEVYGNKEWIKEALLPDFIIIDYKKVVEKNFSSTNK